MKARDSPHSLVECKISNFGRECIACSSEFGGTVGRFGWVGLCAKEERRSQEVSRRLKQGKQAAERETATQTEPLSA